MVSVEWLKEKQEQRRAEETGLLEAHSEFMGEFRQRLCKFLEKAVEAGIEGVGVCRDSVADDGITEWQFTLRDERYFLVTAPRCHRLDFGKPVAAKSFIYREGGGEQTPFLELLTTRSPRSSEYRHEMALLASADREPMRWKKSDDEHVAEGAVRSLLALIYRQIEHTWVDRPRRRSLGELGAPGESARRVLGFSLD